MADDKARILTVLVAGTVTVIGIVIGLIGLRSATSVEGADLSMTTRGLVMLGGGAVIFAVGAMVTLVALVRPLFEKRAVDKHADPRL